MIVRARRVGPCARLVLLIATLAAGAVAPKVFAAEGATESLRDVEFLVLGDDDPVAPIDVAILEVSRSLGVHATRAGGSAHPLAKVTIDRRAPERVVIDVDDRAGRPVVHRELPRGTSPEIAREEISFVLHDAIAVAIAREPPPPTPSATASETLLPAPAPAGSSRSPRFDLSTAIAVRGHDASAGPVFGVGVAGRVVASSGAARPGIALGAEIDAPFDATTTPLDLRVAPYLVRALPMLDVPLDRAFGLEGSLGGGVDVTHVTPRSDSAALVARSATTRASPIVTFAVGGRARIGGTRAVLSLGADVDGELHRYAIASPAGHDVALTPWRVRPFATVTLWFPIAGDDDAP